MTTTYSVTTDLADYAPASTVFISASGFAAGSKVTFRVQHVNGPGVDGVYGTLDDDVEILGGEGHDPWDVIDGGLGDLDGLMNGAIATSWYVNPDDSLDETFLLTATGADWIASASFTDANPNQGNPVEADPGTANFALIEDYLVPDSTGTGVINSFIRLQDDTSLPGFEAGYNTDGRPVQFNEDVSSQNNFSLRYIEIPKVTIGGITYLVLNLDLNESNASVPAALITLQNLKIFTAAVPDLTNMDPATRLFPTNDATLNYELDIDSNYDGDALDAGETNYSVNLTDWNSGSGTGDYQVLIPVQGDANNLGFEGVQPGAYFYIYSEFGIKNGSGYAADGGFEEWFVVRNPSMAIEKTASVDGNIVDAAGDVISYTIVVTNTGSEVLTGITVDDPYVTNLVYASGDLNSNNKLDLLESWTYTASHTVTQDEIDSNGGGDGDLDNEATADSNETEAVQDEAAVPVEQNPLMEIDKEADPDQVADEADEVITYTIKVSNTGNQTLTGVTVADPSADAGSLIRGEDIEGDGDDLLEVGEIWGYTASHTVTQDEIDSNGGGDGDLDNEATADSNETEAVQDQAAVPVEQKPAIGIAKVTVFGETSGDGLTGLQAGDAIIWRYTVTNEGNTALSDVEVTDDNGTPENIADDFTLTQLSGYLSGDSDDDGKLDVDEEWIFEKAGTAISGTYVNVGIASGSAGETLVQDDDESSYIAQTTGALIAPTGTAPKQYIDGTAMTFQDHYAGQDGVIQYGVKGGKINQTNPGVFFYFTGASGDIKDGNNDSVVDEVTIEVDQSRSVSGIKPFSPLNDSNIKLYKVIDDGDGVVDGSDDLEEAPITSITFNNNANSPDYGDLVVTFMPEAEGTMYVLSVKYATSTARDSQVGSNPALLPTSHYEFSTYVDGVFSETYDEGIDLAPKQASLLVLTGEEGDGAPAIRAAQTKAAYKAALSWWAQQGYEDEVGALKKLPVRIDDLGEVNGKLVLGEIQDGQITIDDDAANHGWSLGVGKVTPGKVDLMSVLVHEVGHLLGLDHEQLGDSLGTGVRVLPELVDAGDPPPSVGSVALVGITSEPSLMQFG